MIIAKEHLTPDPPGPEDPEGPRGREIKKKKLNLNSSRPHPDPLPLVRGKAGVALFINNAAIYIGIQVYYREGGLVAYKKKSSALFKFHYMLGTLGS
jgi:hypothetical protein